MKKLFNFLLVLSLSILSFSCQKENISPNKDTQTDFVKKTNSTDQVDEVHDIESSNTLEFSFWISNENVNGTINLTYNGETEVYNISDLTFENKPSIFFPNVNYKCVTIEKNFSDEDLLETTHFFTEININNREVDILNENTINGDYMFLTGSQIYIEPSFNHVELSSHLSTNAWVVISDNITTSELMVKQM